MKYKVTRVELIDSILNKSVVNRVQDLTDDIEVYRKELKEAHRCKRVLLVYENCKNKSGWRNFANHSHKHKAYSY